MQPKHKPENWTTFWLFSKPVDISQISSWSKLICVTREGFFFMSSLYVEGNIMRIVL